ncbi:cilia- and flagella-associated protein 299 [Dunckerocampus dactyliophorus]|uniref:cilia- and flagella-associated protein 299 n=1 Tax=Dunckerocampus dactyliophorus TaxID=161453 RepID=UPI002404DF85|nr:cilia- and flagella-associated protein 299 [Dunckerocampus dactyliophorus]
MDYNTANRFQEPVSRFKVYEDYLDSKVMPMDLFYLKSRESARKLVEHGHKGTVLSREEFQERKAAAQAAAEATRYERNRPTTLASAGRRVKDNFLKALSEREEANRAGKMTSLIFIRDRNALGQEVSGYIDYAHRLKVQDFQAYFNANKRLMPGRLDLCFYNWTTRVSASACSPNYEVIYDDPNGLLFQRKRDKKILNVDPLSGPGEDAKRSVVQSGLYMHVVILDHYIRSV